MSALDGSVQSFVLCFVGFEGQAFSYGIVGSFDGCAQCLFGFFCGQGFFVVKQISGFCNQGVDGRNGTAHVSSSGVFDLEVVKQSPISG